MKVEWRSYWGLCRFVVALVAALCVAVLAGGCTDGANEPDSTATTATTSTTSTTTNPGADDTFCAEFQRGIDSAGRLTAEEMSAYQAALAKAAAGVSDPGLRQAAAAFVDARPGDGTFVKRITEATPVLIDRCAAAGSPLQPPATTTP